MPKTIYERAAQQNDLNALIVLALERLTAVMENLLWKQAMEHELSPLQIKILLSLRSDTSNNSVSILAGKFNLSQATLSVALKPLIEKKLISRKVSVTDRRKFEIKLTDWGNKIAHVAAFYLEPVYKHIAPIDAIEKEAMLKNIQGILGKLQSEMEYKEE